MIRYALSNRQRKDALESGRLIPVAVPLSEAVPREPEAERAYVLDRLQVDPQAIRRVYRTHVGVLCKDDPSGDVPALVGPIWREDYPPDPGVLLVRVEVLVAELCRAGREVRSRYPVQWPGRIVMEEAS